MTRPSDFPESVQSREATSWAFMNPANPPEQDTIPLDPGVPEPSAPAPFPVVGIGASAGGLEAVRTLLQHLPDDTGMAFVVIQHLDPKVESKLPDLLGSSTRMPVVAAGHGEEVRPNHIYVISPNATLSITRGVLQTEPRGEAKPHLPVDIFFRSLAQDRGPGAIGIVLSGSDADGALGVEEIKAAGGITLAQDEETAKFPGMPHSAVRSGCVDLVLPPEGIARELARIGRHPYLDGKAAVPAEEDQFQRILAILRSSTGVDFTAYRDSTIKRRIMRRAVLHTKPTLAEYADFLERNPAEAEALYHDVLINVTSFFRDAETFEALKKIVFPELIKGRAPDTPIRVWVPGCSTGQEAYSLAIALLEFLETTPVRPAIQIFATDLSDEVSLKRAREGIYPKNIELEVSPERLRRYFTRIDDKYRISKAIRDICVFAKQNLAADPPFSRVDLVSCRNVLIYLSPALQRRVIPTFHYALNPVGYLLLGASETIGGFTDLFTVVDHRHRIYVRKATPGRPYPHFHPQAHLTPPLAGSHPPMAPAPDWQREADRIALGHYAPPGVLVNSDLDILQFRGRTGPYLQSASGEPSFNLLRMAPDGLFLILRDLVAESRVKGIGIRRDWVRITDDDRVREVAVRVLPVKRPGTAEQCYLILFEENAPRRGTGGDLADRAVTRPGVFARFGRWVRRLFWAAPPTDSGAANAARLEDELTSARDYLQSVVEQYDATNEELKSANEEILSSNEELQSTNEELETAKEELQSVNEELTTVNEQLQQRNVELARSADDLSNLLASANVPMLLLGVDLRIRRFTPAAGKTLGLLPGDIGRPVGQLKMPVEVSDLEEVAAGVVESVRPVEREVRDRDGGWHILRVYPYRTADNRIDGAVVVLVDITLQKRDEEAIRASAERYRRMIDVAAIGVLIFDESGTLVEANDAFLNMSGYSQEEVASGELTWRKMTPPEYVAESEAQMRKFADTGRIGPYEKEYICKDGSRSWLLFVGANLGDGTLVEYCIHISDRKEAEAALKESERQLRVALAAARMGIWTWEMPSDIHVRGPNLNRLLGLSAIETRQKLDDLLEHIHPGDRVKVRAAFDTSIAQGKPLRIEFRVVWPDGTIRWLRDQGDVFEESAGGVTHMSGACVDITDLKAAEERLRQARDELEERVKERTAEVASAYDALEEQMRQRQELTRQTAKAFEQQQRRIARELHDEMGQHLASLILGLKSLEGGAAAPEALRKLQEIANRIGQDVHRIALELRPTALDDLGLHAALQNYVDNWARRSGIAVELHYPDLEARLSAEMETTVYRIVQEALTNVVKHAGAKQVSVVVERRSGELVAIIEDDGKGFDPDAPADPQWLGLAGMRERAVLLGGSVEIESAPGKGATVFARLPL